MASMMWARGRLFLTTIVGMGLMQFALPKLLPLPGISPRWLLFVPEGGSFARLAAIVGGLGIFIVGVSLLPRHGWGPLGWGLLSAGVALGARLVGVGLALATTPATLTRYPWGAGLPPAISFGVALLLVALCYGVMMGGAVALMQRGAR